MTPLLYSALTAALSVAGLAALILWARLYVQDVKHASRFLDDYYPAAQALVKDPNTPDPVVHFAEFFAERVGTPALARSFATHLLFGRKRIKNRRETELAAALEKLSPTQRDNFTNMVVHGMLSSAASDPLLSRVYLHVLQIFFTVTGRKDGAASTERANTAALDVAEKDHTACVA